MAWIPLPFNEDDMKQEVGGEGAYEYTEYYSDNGLSRWSNYTPPIKKPMSTPVATAPQWGRIAPTRTAPSWGRIQAKPKTQTPVNGKMTITGYEAVPKGTMFSSNIEDTFSKLFQSSPRHTLGNNKG